jgi:hypothetical protein
VLFVLTPDKTWFSLYPHCSFDGKMISVAMSPGGW